MSINQTLKKRNNNKKWKILSSNYALKTPWIKVKRDKVQFPDGRIIDDFFSIVGNELVAVLAFNKNGEILLVKQYRHAIGKATLDLPGGEVRKNELPIVAAKRELVEETGYSAGSMQKMMTYYPDSGKKGDIKHIFLAKNLKNKKEIACHKKEEDEGIIHFWVPFNKIEEGIAKGKFKEATLQLVFLYYVRYFLNCKKEAIKHRKDN